MSSKIYQILRTDILLGTGNSIIYDNNITEYIKNNREIPLCANCNKCIDFRIYAYFYINDPKFVCDTCYPKQSIEERLSKQKRYWIPCFMIKSQLIE